MKKIFFLVPLLIFSLSIMAQSDPPQVSQKYFVQNATVINRPGSRMENTSILIEDGIITKVGANLSAPYDAVLIKADSMFVYPSFIAGISTIGIKKEEKRDERPKVDRTGYPPNDLAGITPEKSISEVYSSSESSIKDFRDVGFAIAHTVPTGKMMPGKGSIISLNGHTFSDAVIKEDVSLFAQFEGANRMFPATIIGVMAKWREMYKNSELSMAHAKSYDLNPKSKKRPHADAATEALYPVITKAIPVYFSTQQHLEIYRALQLQNDMGFDMALTNIKNGSNAISRIKSSRAHSVLSLDLPKEEKAKKDDKSSDEEKALMARKMKSIEEYEGQAALYEKNNMNFSYSLIDVKAGDIMSSLRRMIAKGLTHDKALAALTTEPAKQLKIENIAGTIEVGKSGNIFMATDTIFKESAKIKMLFVDGVQYIMEDEPKKKSEPGKEVADISGTWSFEIEIPGMTPTGEMIVTKDGDDYKIKLTSNQNEGQEMDAQNVVLDNNNLSFDYTVDTQGMTLKINTEITIEGNSFEGQVDVGNFGNFPIKGQKNSSPE
jgi:imidazolonepropionase-like amidohydrolase